MKDIEQMLVAFDYMEDEHVYFYSNSDDTSVFVDCYCWYFKDVWFNSDKVSVKELSERFDCIQVIVDGEVVYSEGW